jgi:hypothetical protein
VSADTFLIVRERASYDGLVKVVGARQPSAGSDGCAQ